MLLARHQPRQPDLGRSRVYLGRGHSNVVELPLASLRDRSDEEQLSSIPGEGGLFILSVEPGFAFILVFLKGNKSMRERTFGRYCVLATVQKQFVSCARQLHKYRQCRGHPGSLLCLLL